MPNYVFGAVEMYVLESLSIYIELWVGALNLVTKACDDGMLWCVVCFIVITLLLLLW